jgi:hypothetical protein
MKHRLEQLGAATALTGALLNTVACAEEEAPDVHSPISASSTIETPDTSPQNRVARCVLEASRIAILGVLDSPRTVRESEKDGYFTTYLYRSKEDPSDISNIMIDDSVDGQTSFVYSITTGAEDANSYTARGRITLSGEASEAKHTLQDLDLNSLPAAQLQEIIDFKSSGITELAPGGTVVAGSTIDEVYTPDSASTECDVIDDFAEDMRNELGI